jgi:hypothetical protein
VAADDAERRGLDLGSGHPEVLRYYGITGNAAALAEVSSRVTGLWRRWLSRRSWAGRLSWDGFKRLLGRLALPGPRVVHSVLLT